MSPGRINAEDLTAAQRRKILGRAQRATPRRATRSRPEPDTTGSRWRCFSCGAVFTRWAPAQRHATGTGHRRIIFDLEGDV